MQKREKSRSLSQRQPYNLRSDAPGNFLEEPEADYSGFYDARNSFVPVWVSLPPFVVMEYFVELSLPRFPSALVFPVGFLLFWAFYFTFYKPNVLEDRLSDPLRWKLNFTPSLLLGFALWFIQASFLELRYLVLQSLRVVQRKKLEVPQPETPAPKLPHARPNAPATSSEPAKPRYPAEVQAALGVLGLPTQTAMAWNDIHKQYRALAKKLHPDLNDTGTQGRRFIEVDQAYRKLGRHKDLFS